MRFLIKESKAKISYNGIPTLMADATQLAWIFQNLVGIVIKLRSNRPVEIEILTERKGEEWYFVVNDNGIGIEEHNFDRIFPIFKRLHSREGRLGRGIGLAVCTRIVERTVAGFGQSRS